MVAAVMLASAAHAGEREGCRLCGMYIDQYQGTSAIVTSKDGRIEKTCGGADMLRLVADAGGVEAFSSVLVHDWLSGKEIAAAGATYVIGSDLVPDMIPNIIAFADQDGAKKFISEHGGQPLTFSQALLAVSPMGMTMPNRVNSAVPPPNGSVSFGAGYMSMVKDDLMMGSNKVSTAQYLAGTGTRSPLPMIPQKMEASGPMAMANYGITDRLSVTAKISDLDKTMTSTMRTSSVERVTKHKGITDLELKAVYNLWRDDYYSKFVSLMGNATLPTGDFDTTFRTMPGLQLGTGSINLGGGLLGSACFGDFWLHGEASYLANRENGDDYKFGDVGKLGAALHYTPNYDLMLGVELDATDTAKNENFGAKVQNSGGRAIMLTGVASWRFLSAFGGNFSLNGSYGIPLYEDVNLYGLGTEYVATGMLNFKHRFNY
ncbi:MAG: nitrous oxide reductase accessory protein NosL [Desulfurivibrionaceae bacterium]